MEAVYQDALIAYMMMLGAQNITQADVDNICVIAGDLTNAKEKANG